ncbi:MAG: FHA domain-containing protein [Elusimicrobia bacterium]|nr:FHA domain-containing protein [Elusimicrobiota bacterium]
MIYLGIPPNHSCSWRPELAQWVLREGADGRTTVPIRETPFVIGRAADCQLVLPNSPELAKTTSRWHCHITRKDDGCLLADGSLKPAPETGKVKPSISGTLLNGKRLAQPAPLRGGDVIGVGPWVFEVRAAEEKRVDIDDILRTINTQPSRAMDARSSRGFAQLHELFRRLSRVHDAQEGLFDVLDYALSKIAPAVVAAVLEEGPEGGLAVRAACHRDAGRLLDLRFSSGLVQGLPADRSILLAPSGRSATASQVEAQISSGLVVPLRGLEQRLGLLYMDNRTRGGSFSEDDLHLAQALASVAALQLSLEKQAFFSRLAQNMRGYFGPEVVSLIVEASRAGRPLGLGVRGCEATVLFADLQGFSAFCRGRSPQQVSELLNPFYRVVSERIQEHGGHVDKFLGDGVMGVFGAQPVQSASTSRESHAVQAARCGLAIAAAWGGASLSQGDLRLPVRVGLNTGAVVAGNIGFAGRMEYGVIGDAVNLASRMEKLARPNAVAFTDSTRGLIGAKLPCEDGGLREVQGFGQVRVWRMGA